jgi:hypothetical protein
MSNKKIILDEKSVDLAVQMMMLASNGTVLCDNETCCHEIKHSYVLMARERFEHFAPLVDLFRPLVPKAYDCVNLEGL